MSIPARSQLARLAGDPDLLSAWPRMPRGDETTREAAVLVLFGDRAASASADRAPDSVHELAEEGPYGLDVLLLARAQTLRSHAGQVAFPGGRRDPTDVSLVETALREAQEETGLDPTGVDVLGELRPLGLPRSSHLVTPVLAWWERPSPVRALDPAESAHVFRTPVRDLVRPDYRVTTVLRHPSGTWRGPAWQLNVDGTDQLLWGFTAGILDALLTRLDWAEPWDTSRIVELDATPDRVPRDD